MPSGGGWGVLSIMPRICFAAASAAAGSSASFTPPALPRPPACTCALTTTLPPSFAAIAFACAGVSATSPFGTGTPNSRRIALPWYSWIFIAGLGSGSKRRVWGSHPDQDPQSGHGARYGAAVAQDGDGRPGSGEPHVLHDEAEAVRPVVEGQRDEHEEIDLDERLSDEGQQP